MKKQNSNLQLNNFHLQLYALQEEQNNIVRQSQVQQQSIFYRIEYFSISISITSSLVYFTLYFIWFINLFDTYIYCYNKVYNPNHTPLLHTITNLIFSQNIIGYIINISLELTIIISLSFHSRNADEGIFYFLWYFGDKTYEYLRYFIQGVFFISAYFASTGDTISLIIFVIACLIACFYTTLLQNITLRKDQFCCKSLDFSIIFRITVIVSLIINLIGNIQVSNSAQLIGCSLGHLVLSMNLLICYFNFGLIIYRHKAARYSLFLIITLYFIFSFSFFIDILATLYYSYLSSNIYQIFIINLIAIQFFLISSIERLKRDSHHPQSKKLKNKIYFSFNKYEQADEDEEVDCEIRGILHEHYTKGCKNMQCIANIKQVYDSKKKKKCSINKIAQGKVSVIKFYVKCLYQMALKQNPNDIHLEIDFIQFYYLKLKNVFTVLKKIKQLELGYLTFYQKLRLNRIKKYLILQSNQFSVDLYHKSLSMCKIIRSEQIFLKIQNMISLVLQRNELFWKYLSFNEINLRQILKIVIPNFKLIQYISQQWNNINNYFYINRRWKFYYICYTIFIKNQKIKPIMIQDFGNSVQYDSIFKTDNYFVDKTLDKQLLYNPIMLFQQNTCYLHAKCDQEKMIITKVSNFFQRNFDFDPQEIINSSIHILMPPSIIKFHHKMFLSWIKDGKSNNESYYEIKKLYPLTKRGYLYPCFKFYKRYIQLSGQIDYIAMFKSNKQDQHLILVNDDFQIQGITISLHHKLKLHAGDYLYFKGINILALMPMLIKYTKFCSSITEKDEDFLQNDDNRNYFKKQGTYVKGKQSGQSQQTNILHERKSINLANVKFYLPHDFQATLQYYKNLSIVKKMQKFDTIRELYKWLRKDKKFSKFKAQICIRQRQILNTIYYEIQINELQQNNRLQKLKMSQLQSQNSRSYQQSCRQIQQSRLNEIDMQLFFSMSKKKNKVILFPSKNIFLKDEHNRALSKIGHINNINIFVRISLFIFISLLLVQMFLEMSTVSNFDVLSNQYSLISRYQKLTFMLNTQYNIQHIQPGNYWQQSFVIISYTHQLIICFNSTYFQKLIYDNNINTDGSYQPYQKILKFQPAKNRTQLNYDQYSIFFKIYQCAIALHRLAEQHPESTLQTVDYYQINNYIYSFYSKAQQLQINIKNHFLKIYNNLRNIDMIFGIIVGIIVIGCLIFSVSRLWKVSNGFKQMVSILIQIDSTDLRDIIKYVDYTKYLFQHLNQKNQRMALQNQTQYSSTSSNFRSFQKKSSEITEQQQLRLANSSANLNKKIKKMQIGQQITNMMLKPTILLLFTISFIGIILVTLNIYSIISLDNYYRFWNIGFNFMQHNGANNVIANGALEKFRQTTLYNYSKYSSFIQTSLQIQNSNTDISLTLGDSQLQRNLKSLYFQNFCKQLQYMFVQTLEYQFEHICDPTDAKWCENVFKTFTLSKVLDRCAIIQQKQLTKGLENYDNYFLQQVVPFFKDSSNLTIQNVVQINDAYKIIDIVMIYLMKNFIGESSQMVLKRQNIIIIIVICLIIIIILLNIICIEYLVKNNLNESYEIFRKIHEHYIPQWVIIKQKIIKVKLIKQGFMKQ